MWAFTNCTLAADTPFTLPMFRLICTPDTVASAGRLNVVPSTAMFVERGAAVVTVTFVLKLVDRILEGLVHCGKDDASFPATVGVWFTLVEVPEVVEAYEVSPRILLGLAQVFPPTSTTVAEVGALGPTKFPTVELAMPESPVKVPKETPPAGTTAVKVLAAELTEVTNIS